MKEYIIELGTFVYEEVKGQKGTLKNRLVNGYSQAEMHSLTLMPPPRMQCWNM